MTQATKIATSSNAGGALRVAVHEGQREEREHWQRRERGADELLAMRPRLRDQRERNPEEPPDEWDDEGNDRGDLEPAGPARITALVKKAVS
jgi:hypothetical protein